MDNSNLLILVGAGIKSISHITIEAKAAIEQSHKVLFLVNEPILKEWIIRNNPNSQSLEFIYKKHLLRAHNYEAISQHIIRTMDEVKELCVVLYGHPTVYSMPGLNAAKAAKKLGARVKIFPGISAEDCLFADLFIDPGSHGCQSFEATDFLQSNRRFDPYSHLILWQADSIYCFENNPTFDNYKGVSELQNKLIENYSENHPIFLYEASLYPGIEAKIKQIKLVELCTIALSSITTLYLPPL